MKRRDFIASLIAMQWAPLVKGVENSACLQPIVEYPNKPEVTGLTILQPGKYCLHQDYYQRKLGCCGHYGSGMLSMVRICCGNVLLDFSGHILKSDYMQRGVWLSKKRNIELFKIRGWDNAADYIDSRFVTIRNGTINLAEGEDETWTGIELIDAWHPYDFNHWQISETRPSQFDGNYTRNDYLLENLNIYTRDIGVLIEGSHSVIRNCVIHASGQGGIISAGPNLTIENCEIWLKPSSGEQHVANDMSRAGIILCDGSNAVIRNNIIRVSPRLSRGRQPNCIVVRDRASNVLIEGNTFISALGEDVRLAKGAQVIERNNKHIRRWLPW